MIGRYLLVYPVCVLLLGIAALHTLFPSGVWHLPPMRSWREFSMLGLGCYLVVVSLFLARRAVALPRIPRVGIVALAVAVLLTCWIGGHLVMQDHFSSRDEQMAVFDAGIFASGRLFAELPIGWAEEAQALNLEFILPLERQTAWVSAYLPMNAAIRSLFALVSLEALASPVLAACAVLLLWSCARAMWPQQRGPAVVAILVLLGSGQFILTAMTASAMTAHLVLNLLWLRLFLFGRPRADGAAVLVGFVATGLHQPLFHPLFVAPFLAILLVRREWRRLLPLVIGYALICAFWLGWPQLIAELAGGASRSGGAASVDYLDRFLATVRFDYSNLALLAYNVVGFAGWQHLLLLPLMVLGMREARKNDLGGTLAASVVLPFAAMTVILPFQGFGYGYRYVHGALGSAALLAGFAWRALSDADRRLAERLLAWTTAFSLLVMLPFQMWSAYSSLRPFALAEQRIARSELDLFVLETSNGRYVENLAFNSPDLDRKPVRLLAERVRNPRALAARLCTRRATVGFGSTAFYARGLEAFRDPVPDRAGQVVRAAFEEAGCRVTVID